MRWLIDQEISLISFLKGKVPQLSAKKIKKMIEANSCTVNGRLERFASRLLHRGDTLILLMPAPPQKRELASLLYEDEVLLAIDKPPFYASDPEGLQAMLGERFVPALSLVHRLDKETSGVLLIAKSELALSKLEELFRQRLVKKRYLAIADGLLPSAGVVDNFLARVEHFKETAMIRSVPAKQGLRAITQWQVLQTLKKASLVACLPVTGRTHQIRVHLSEMGHPILGERKYASAFRSSYRPPRCLLHAQKLQFPHPLTAKMITIQAPEPPDFAQALHSLG